MLPEADSNLSVAQGFATAFANYIVATFEKDGISKNAAQLAAAAGSAGLYQVATQRQSWLAAPSLRSLRLYDRRLSGNMIGVVLIVVRRAAAEPHRR
jgi:hypothetical protein